MKVTVVTVLLKSSTANCYVERMTFYMIIDSKCLPVLVMACFSL